MNLMYIYRVRGGEKTRNECVRMLSQDLRDCIHRAMVSPVHDREKSKDGNVESHIHVCIKWKKEPTILDEDFFAYYFFNSSWVSTFTSWMDVEEYALGNSKGEKVYRDRSCTWIEGA